MRKGFAAMPVERQKAIASQGGKAAHAKGTAHQWTGGEGGSARSAGAKGGQSVSQNRAHMAAIGKRGGQARATQRKS